MSCGVWEVGPSRRQQAKLNLKGALLELILEYFSSNKLHKRKEPNKPNLKGEQTRNKEGENTAWYAG